MAYSTPPTKSTGDTLTAADWNSYVRGNFETVGKPPYAWLYRTSDLSVANATFTGVNWQATSVLTGMTQTGGTVTVLEAGIYRVQVLISWNASAYGERKIRIFKGAAVQHEGHFSPYFSTSAGVDGTGIQNHNLVMDVSCAANDTISVQAYQSSGGALTLRSGSIGASTLQIAVASR